MQIPTSSKRCILRVTMPEADRQISSTPDESIDQICPLLSEAAWELSMAILGIDCPKSKLFSSRSLQSPAAPPPSHSSPSLSISPDQTWLSGSPFVVVIWIAGALPNVRRAISYRPFVLPTQSTPWSPSKEVVGIRRRVRYNLVFVVILYRTVRKCKPKSVSFSQEKSAHPVISDRPVYQI